MWRQWDDWWTETTTLKIIQRCFLVCINWISDQIICLLILELGTLIICWYGWVVCPTPRRGLDFPFGGNIQCIDVVATCRRPALLNCTTGNLNVLLMLKMEEVLTGTFNHGQTAAATFYICMIYLRIDVQFSGQPALINSFFLQKLLFFFCI